jgi:hypothetical protein
MRESACYEEDVSSFRKILRRMGFKPGSFSE